MVTTAAVSNVTQESANAGGTVVNDGGDSILTKGVCWNTEDPPTLENMHTKSGSGPGPFASNLTWLSCRTEYFVRAYATNSVGTGYGSTVSFTTADCAGGSSILSTSGITGITLTSAVCGGTVVEEGSSPVSARGVCWSTSPNPILDDGHSEDGGGTGPYVSSITELESNTRYYVRAYCVNSEGVSYGNEVNFITYLGKVGDYDGNSYYTVEIGEQVWMAENLKAIHFPDGTPVPLVEDKSVWAQLNQVPDARAYCWYDNNDSVGAIYGALYTWHAALNGHASTDANPSGVQGICPNGWHMPSDAEWKQLEMHLGMSQEDADKQDERGTDEGGKLKEYGEEHWIGNTLASNESGFSAIPGGGRDNDGTFGEIGFEGLWWTATEMDERVSWFRQLSHHYAQVRRFYSEKEVGISIRCVKDEGVSGRPVVSTTSISGITESSAASGGEVTSDGGATVTVSGVCWSTLENPSLASNDGFTTDGTGTGTFTSAISGLDCNTTYFVRAYATNSAGTEYGNQVEFTTNSCPQGDNPTVVTALIANITPTSAEGGGEVTGDGGATVMDRGVCWSESPNPSISDLHTSDGTGIGPFSSSITDLAPNTLYYVRAFATNSYGTAYGEERTITTQMRRRSVLEYFTNAAGDSIYAADSAVSRFALDHEGMVYDLHYHMDYPATDPMNQNNPTPPSSRAFTNNVPLVPYAVLNGGVSSEYRFDLTLPMEEIDEGLLQSASEELPSFELELTVDFLETRMEGNARIICLDD